MDNPITIGGAGLLTSLVSDTVLNGGSSLIEPPKDIVTALVQIAIGVATIIKLLRRNKGRGE